MKNHCISATYQYLCCDIQGFVTEIHHINGKGENKGVVYCEMQVRCVVSLLLTYYLMLSVPTNILSHFFLHIRTTIGKRKQ